MRALKPLEINIISAGGSIAYAMRIANKIKKAESEGRLVVLRIDSNGWTAAKWQDIIR